MNNSTEDESAFSAVSRIPIAPFSAFLNGNFIKMIIAIFIFIFVDLNRPFFSSNLRPSAEIVKTGDNFPKTIEAPERIPAELFDCPAFNPSKM